MSRSFRCTSRRTSGAPAPVSLTRRGRTSSRAPWTCVPPRDRDHDPGAARVIAWLLRRLIQAIFVILVMTMIVFVAVNVIGNPVDILISPEADQAERLRAIHALGLDLPLWQQYLRFLWDALHGNLGNSFVYNEPALTLILQRMPATMELAVSAVLLSILLGIPLGLYCGLRPNGVIVRTVMAGSILGFSLPTFWVGLM